MLSMILSKYEIIDVCTCIDLQCVIRLTDDWM
jgi:hypothetical protein